MNQPIPNRLARIDRGLSTVGKYVAALLGGACALLISLLFITMIAFGGCRNDVIDVYGQAIPAYLGTSVNGTDVLIEMFRQAGHEVATRHVLVTSKMETVDTIVWFPDDLSAPNEEACDWFDTWLAARSGRTLVYVGRNFDAAPLYWRSMLPYVSKEQQTLYREQLFHSAAVASRQGSRTTTIECPWFTIEAGKSRAVRTLAGRWSEGIDPSNVGIELRDRVVPAKGANELLTSMQDVLVSRQSKPEWTDSKIIVVENGSFLLNLPLVNHDHRVLAERLVAAVGSPWRVVFLQSGHGGPSIDPTGKPLGLWRFLAAWPLNVVLLQLAVLGIIFCFARWPILGRPKAPPVDVTSDFRKHVDAVGRLLRATRNRDYAWRQVGHSGKGLSRERPSSSTETS